VWGKDLPLELVISWLERSWPFPTNCPPGLLCGRASTFWREIWSKHHPFQAQISNSWSIDAKVLSKDSGAYGPCMSTIDEVASPGYVSVVLVHLPGACQAWPQALASCHAESLAVLGHKLPKAATGANISSVFGWMPLKPNNPPYATTLFSRHGVLMKWKGPCKTCAHSSRQGPSCPVHGYLPHLQVARACCQLNSLQSACIPQHALQLFNICPTSPHAEPAAALAARGIIIIIMLPVKP
jgi:hypothetical protein